MRFLPRLTGSRRRLWILTGLQAVVALGAGIACGLYVHGLVSFPGQTRLLLMISGGTAALTLLVVASGGLLDRRLLSPMTAVARGAEILAHAHPHHEIELPRRHWLERLPDSIQTLGDTLAASESDLQRAASSWVRELDDQRVRLEALLDNCSEGLIACDDEDRIVLFNETSRRLLAEAPALGRGRAIGDVIDDEPLRRAVSQARDRGVPGTPISFTSSTESGTTGVRGRVLLMAGPPFDLGYLIILTEPRRGSPRSETRHRRLRTVPVTAPGPADALVASGGQPSSRSAGHPSNNERKGTRAGAPLATLNFVVFDTVTTGLEPEKGDEIISIGAVRVSDGQPLENERFERLVDPGRPIPAASSRFHGLTDDIVRNAEAPAIEPVLRDFHRFVGDAVLVAHNAAFDLRFLQLKQRKAGVKLDRPVLDTLLLSLLVHDHAREHTLEAIAHRLGVTASGRHTAIGDAMTTAEIFSRLLRLLPATGVHTLEDALDASRYLVDSRRRQRAL